MPNFINNCPPSGGGGGGGTSEVLSVNGKKGHVTLRYNDVGAIANILNSCGGIQVGTLNDRPVTANNSVLYIVTDKLPNEFYRFNSSTNNWEQIGGQQEDKEVIAIEVTFTNTGTGLISTNLQDVIVELNNLISDNDINVKQLIESNKGKVQLNSGDVLGFLDTKIDNSTITIDNGKLTVVKLKGLEATIAELNYTKGLTENVQEQIDRLSRIGNFTGAVDTKADLLALENPSSNDMVIVIADESKGGITTIYMHNGTGWEYVGDFNVELRDFTTDPIKLGSEVAGILAEQYIDPLIARKTDIKNINTTDELQEGVSNLYYTEARVSNNADVRANTLVRHSHINKNTLDDLSESQDGRLMFKGQLVNAGGSGGMETEWEDF